MGKKVDPKSIERLEAFVRSKKIEDAKRRHVESFSKMSDEEVASLGFVARQFEQEEDPSKTYEFFTMGLAATKRLDERGRLGWRRYCETGGQAAVVDFSEAHDDEGSPSRTPGFKGDLRVLFEDVNPGGRRTKGVNFHRARLAGEPEQKKALSERATRPKSDR